MNKIKILIPVYNDWQSVFKLLENINVVTSKLDSEFSIIIVNDASSESSPKFFPNLNNLKSIQIINMKENRGHARCNAAGLKYISEKKEFDCVIPMDADGEDRPDELCLLIDKNKDFPNRAITADRVKRSEGFIFRFFYFAHKYLTFLFTGQIIKFGNYTCLPKSIVNEMVNESATWSSFSGSLAKIAKDRKSIPSERGVRYFGPSKMSFLKLLKHSLSIIAVFKKTLLFRSILFLITYLFLMMGKISAVTLIPVIGVVILIISVIILSRRENILEFKSSLENIMSINEIK
jgi:hypothetical protein